MKGDLGKIEIGYGLTLVEAASGKAPTRILLVNDGDMGWIGAEYTLDEESAKAVIAEFDKNGVDVPIDHHHATKHAEDDPGAVQAEAAGWIKRLEYVPGEGLYAHVEWTADGAKQIEAKKFKYISPSLYVVKETGKPILLHSAALTNRPRTRGQRELLEAAELAVENIGRRNIMDPKKLPGTIKLVAGQDDEGGDAMGMTPEGKLFVQLQVALGLSDDASPLEILTAAVAAAKKGEGDEETVSEEVATALGIDKGSKIELVCAEISKLKATADQAQPTADRLKTLEEANAAREKSDKERAANELVQAQITAGKILPDATTLVESSRKFALSDPEGFKAWAETLPVICPPGELTSANAPPPKGRAAILAKATKEYKPGPLGLSLTDSVNGELLAQGQKGLTDDERTKLEEAA
jgi:phage I-like protein